MSAHALEFSIALSNNERTRPVIEGRHQPQGIKFMPTVVHPSEMFWRQLKFAEFDVSEMSISSLLIAVSKGDTRFVAIPIYTARMFFHTRIMVRRDSGINSPADRATLKESLQRFLSTRRMSYYVVAYASASARDGGVGCVYVLLSRQQH